MGKIVYLDNAATTPVSERVAYTMFPYFTEEYGNPSTSYSLGRKARETVENCRANIAKLLNCETEGILFTSGGSESDNMLIKGLAKANKGTHIITSSIEHPAVLKTCEQLEKEGYDITYLPVNTNGRIDIEVLKKSIRADTCLITIMYANNETGVLQPLEEIIRIAHQHNILVHSDMVQAIGHIPIDIKHLGVDSFSCSGHKFGAPKGIGIAYIKSGIKGEPLIVGGGQEKEMRAGTENVPSIVGMDKALTLVCNRMIRNIKKQEELRARFIEKMEGIKHKINGSYLNRLAGTINIAFKGIDGENLKLYLDTKGICVSNGSACHSGNTEPSHVLKAMHVPEEYINGAIRISFGNNSIEEVDYLAKCIKEYLKEVRINGKDTE